MTRVPPVARLRAVLAGLAVVLLTFSAAGAIVLVSAQVAHASAVFITGPSVSTGITQNPTVFTGTGTPGDTVTLTGTLLTSSPCASGVTVDSGGAWTCDANFSAPGGATTVTATQTGDGSTATGSYDVAFPPTEQLTLTSPGRYATNNNSLTIPGTDAISGGTVQGTLTAGTTTYNCFYNTVSGPSFSCVGFSAIPDGDYTLQLDQRYGTATSAMTAPVTVRIDTLGPDAAPRFLSPYDSSGANGNVHTTDASMPVSGTYVTSGGPEAYATVHVVAAAEPPSTATVSSTSPVYCDAVTDSSGNWSCTPPTPMTFGDFYGFTVYGVDEAGNTGISPDPEFGAFVDVPAPVPEQTTLVQNQPIVELIGSGVAGGSIHGVFSNGQTCDAVVNAGSYECDVTLSPATDGTYTVDLTQTVGSASSLTTAQVTVVLDQTPPTGYPIFSGPWATGSSPARAVSTSDAVTFSGSAEPLANVTVYVSIDADGYPADVTPITPVCGTTADSEGAWSCQSSPGEGTSYGVSYSVGVQQRDEAYNPGPAAVATFELSVDAPPQAPTIVTPQADSGSNLRSGDPVTFSGANVPGTTVKVSEGAAVLCQSFSSSGSWSCSVPNLPDGAHTVAAVAVDSLGVSSAAASRTFTVLPKAIAKTPLSFVIGITDAAGNPLDGTDLTPGEVIYLWSSGLPVGSTVFAELHSTPYPLGSSVVGSDGVFKLKTTIPADVVPGTHEFAVTVTPQGDVPTTVVAPTSVAPLPAAPTDAATPPPPTGAGAPRPGSHSANGFDSPSTFASTLPPFGSFAITPTTVAVTGGVALAFLLLVAFPSELLEDTLRENYDRAFGWLAPVRRRIDHLRGRFGRILRNPWAGIAVSVVATSVILGFSDPSFGFTGASVRLLIGMLISVAVINIGITLLVIRVAKREYGDAGYIRPMPAALLIVALSVLVSRLADISPGFLFGLVMGVAYARELKLVQEAKLALLGAALTIAAGILAWLGFSALRAAGGSGFWYQLSLETLVAITLEAVGTMIIAMLPLTFLDGRTIFRWNKWAWAGVYLLTVVVFVVIVMPISNNWGVMSAPIFGWGTLFVVFAVVAFGTWAVFRFVPGRRAATTSSPEDAEEPQPQLR
ncbi:MAG TPA: FGLLP motif-containing membrane protein [Pseudolysinimonas sp.]|nr:FGLLP motif-containing membrane protein [Pseudolysinimonas sp.]